MIKKFEIPTKSQGLVEITREIANWLRQNSSGRDGLVTLFIQHTSASFVIQENADPSAKRDLEKWLSRLVQENDPLFTHTFEGPDDMPAHIKAALTQTSLSIPFENGVLSLGTWQGIYLWEHRDSSHRRTVVAHLAMDTQDQN